MSSAAHNSDMTPSGLWGRFGGCRVFLTVFISVFLGWSTVMARGHGTASRVQPSRSDKRELWLVDYTKDHLYQMQADGALGRGSRTSPPQCPPPPRQRPHHACRVTPCRSDKECTKTGHRCCHNGCAFTCMATMPPPPVVDWRREPERSDRGISWLLKNEDSDTENKFPLESCSTSVLAADEDALLCPHGYLCHIEYLGDVENGVPNSGRCIPDVRDPEEISHRIFRVKTHTTPGGCAIGNRKYTDGASFSYERHPCRCHGGTITCRVGRRQTASRNT